VAFSDYIERWVKVTNRGTTDIAPSLMLTNTVGEDIDWAGLTSMTMRLQLGSADELTINIMARDNEGNFRPDMGAWQKGATLYVNLGYDGTTAPMQEFTVVSTTVDYPEVGAESMAIRCVSDLARALHNRDSRVFTEADDTAVLDAICADYGWQNGVDGSLLANTRPRIKKKGSTDLDLLRTIARDALLGGPTVDVWGTLHMPEATVGPQVYSRGAAETSGADRLLLFKPSREGGADAIQVQITAWDPVEEQFVDTVFQADEFSSDPEVVFEGKAASQPTVTETSTRGLTLKIIEVRGHGESAKKDVLGQGRFVEVNDAEDLARRWFALREKTSRWASLTVPGHNSLFPYLAVEVEGQLAETDKGIWLPTVVEHTINDSGWRARITAIRVVQDTTVKAVE
jgi:phage protein D